MELFEKLDGPLLQPPSSADELARLVRLEWDRNGQARGAAHESAVLRSEAVEIRSALAVERARVADHESEGVRTKEGLAATEIRLAATEQRLAATEQRLAATEEQLAAAVTGAEALREENAELRRLHAAVQATRTMRWTRRLRGAYGQARRWR